MRDGTRRIGCGPSNRSRAHGIKVWVSMGSGRRCWAGRNYWAGKNHWRVRADNKGWAVIIVGLGCVNDL